MTGNIDMNSNRIVNFPAPTAGNQAATKSYVDSLRGLNVILQAATATYVNGFIKENAECPVSEP